MDGESRLRLEIWNGSFDRSKNRRTYRILCSVLHIRPKRKESISIDCRVVSLSICKEIKSTFFHVRGTSAFEASPKGEHAWDRRCVNTESRTIRYEA